MARISLGEANSLASVFGELDLRMATLLLQFREPRSKYDALLNMQQVPKDLRIPRASLYRRVEEFRENGFLHVEETRTFAKGTLRMPINVYGLSVKGLIAADIYSYVRFLSSTTESKGSRTADHQVKRLERSQEWRFIISFLKWHRERGIDLSRARIDFMYVYVIGLLSLYERPDEIEDPVALEFLRCARAMGRESEKIALAAGRQGGGNAGSATALQAFTSQFKLKRNSAGKTTARPRRTEL